MSWLSALPAAATLLLSLILARVSLPLHPAWSSRLLAVVAGTTAVTVTATFAVFAAGFLGRPSADVAALISGGHPMVTPLLGLGAAAYLCLRAPAAVRVVVRRAQEIRRAQAALTQVADTDVPYAVAVPGRRGGVLVSRGLLTDLSGPELEVVFLHEGAHLRHHHHRFLYAGALATALLPPLETLNQRLRYALERWADEEAADAVGDRSLVAKTIARVALAQTSQRRGEAAFAEWGVTARVQALLGTPPGKNPVTGPFVVGGTGLATSGLASSALQIDHILVFVLL